jgi:hypothetical protein
MGEEYVRVFATHSWLQSEIVKGRLEAEGVPVQLSGEPEGPYPGGPAGLFVPQSFESQARRSLVEIETGRTRFRTSTGTHPSRSGLMGIPRIRWVFENNCCGRLRSEFLDDADGYRDDRYGEQRASDAEQRPSADDAHEDHDGMEGQ